VPAVGAQGLRPLCNIVNIFHLMSRRPKRTFIEGRTISKIKRRTERTSCGWKNLDRTEGKYLSTINYTSKPLLRQTSAVVSKQRTENSNPIPNSCIPSPVSCLLSPVSTRKLILHDYLSVTANHFPRFTYYILCFLSRGFQGFSKDVTVRFEKIGLF
jgi:hypothetical protein